MKISITVEFLLEICKVYGHLAVFLYAFDDVEKQKAVLQYFQRTLYAS